MEVKKVYDWRTGGDRWIVCETMRNRKGGMTVYSASNEQDARDWLNAFRNGGK
tara:strand:+ start:3560 stop:3718 length:159 start_codon:yes stop_codon:yes gene_type:complete